MNTQPSVLRLSARLLRIVACLGVCLGLTVRSVTAADAVPGSITGSVSSISTKNALQQATVSIPGLNRTELTDSAGQFSFANIPAGVQELVVTYSGFTDLRERVVVTAGQSATVDLKLSNSDVVAMAAFTVEVQKEGQALSIAEQRNAPTSKPPSRSTSGACCPPKTSVNS